MTWPQESSGWQPQPGPGATSEPTTAPLPPTNPTTPESPWAAPSAWQVQLPGYAAGPTAGSGGSDSHPGGANQSGASPSGASPIGASPIGQWPAPGYQPTTAYPTRYQGSAHVGGP